MNTKQSARHEVIARCASALKTLESRASRETTRAYGKVYASLTRAEQDAIKGLLGEQGQDLYRDVSERFLAAVKARCSAAIVQSAEDTYHYWREELAERWAS